MSDVSAREEVGADEHEDAPPSTVEGSQDQGGVAGDDGPDDSGVASLMGDAVMPPVDEYAVSNATKAPEEKTPDTSAPLVPVKGKTDDKGYAPTRETHQWDTATGNWKLTKKGFIMRRVGGAAAKRLGEQSKVTPKAASAKPGNVQATASGMAVQVLTPQEMEARLDIAAKSATNCTAMASMIWYGADDGALKQDKKDGVDEVAMWYTSWKDYMRARGVIDIPPGVALAMAAMSHVAARMNTEGHKRRAKTVKEKMLGWFADWRVKRYKRRLTKQGLSEKEIAAEMASRENYSTDSRAEA